MYNFRRRRTETVHTLLFRCASTPAIARLRCAAAATDVSDELGAAVRSKCICVAGPWRLECRVGIPQQPLDAGAPRARRCQPPTSESHHNPLTVSCPEQEERGRVAKFVHLDDRKRALVSQLLQRWACERALGVPFRHVALQRTKGGKPFLTARLGVPMCVFSRTALMRVLSTKQAEAAVRPVAAANWNFNVSHEGDYVVMAAEPLCVCGVDVAAPAQLRRKGAGSPPMSQLLASFSRQLAARETQYILTAGSEGMHRCCSRMRHRKMSSDDLAAVQRRNRTHSRRFGA